MLYEWPAQGQIVIWIAVVLGSKINYYVNGTKQGTLGVRINTKLNLPDDWSGVIYSDINGGSQSGAKTTRAGFNARGGYYYIIVESRLNTGITIEPQASSDNGFCVRDMCDNKACTSIYHSPPTSFPPPSTSPPEPPLYSCPKRGVDYKVTFCPSGGFAPPRNSEPIPIHPRGDLSKCLDVRAGNVVQINTCDGRESQKWLVSAGLTLINLFGTPFCLDAGKQLGDGSALTVQQCTYNPPDSQSWDYTEDKRFQLYLTGEETCKFDLFISY
ncbi:hypothetical protein H0H93_011848 [Arthromyces matolae]|nr:hypothetical protein H0H93_011848 [Arthromyces matolae]